MKRILFIILVVIILILSVNHIMGQSNKLEVGDTIPTFILKDQNNNNFDIDIYRGKVPMVIYFYPKDDTPGCIKEACAFRDEFEAFTDLNVKVIGISSDDAASHKKFEKKYNLPFTLLADTKKEVRKLFGVPNSLMGLIPGRVTYIINKSGIVSHIFNSQFGSEEHITESLSILNATEK